MDLIKIKRHPKYYKDIEERRIRLKSISVPDLIGEEWKDVIGYEGNYKISTFSRIKSVCRIATKEKGNTVLKPEQLLRPHSNSDGYFIVSLTKDRIHKTHSFHILIAKVFVPNPNNLPEVNHIDGNKSNCLPNNLEWNTRKENMIHSVKNGLRKYVKGAKTGRYKIPKDNIMEIFNSHGDTAIIAKKYGVTKSSIQRIRNGKTYSNITKAINN